MTGATIFYDGVPGSPNQLVVTVKLYRDCSGIPYEIPITLNVESPSLCGTDNDTSIALNAGTGIGNAIATSAYPPCATSTCVGGTGFGVEEWVYTDTVTVTTACQDWSLMYSSCCRTQPPGGNMYVTATHDNLNFPGDHSPRLNHFPVVTICVGRTHSLDMSSTDPDGDSLAYILDTATVTNATPTIDSQTGIITFFPTTIERGVLIVVVESYDRPTGIFKGSVRSEVEVNVEATCTYLPSMDSLRTLTNLGTMACNDSVLHFKLDWNARCASIATDGSDFEVLSPSGFSIPVTQAQANNCSPLLTDSITLLLGAPGLFENGLYTLIVKSGTDTNTLADVCNRFMPADDTSYFSFNNCFTGIEELFSKYSLEIFPVPAMDFMIIKTNAPGMKKVSIFNAFGQFIMEQTMPGAQQVLDTSTLPNGVYFLKLLDGSGARRKLFSITR